MLGLEGHLPHLQEALTHPSYSNEQPPSRRVDNQRLEFLGDAVLGLVVGELLMERFPIAREGELSLMRSLLVNAEALATWARRVGLGAAIRVGRGAEAAGERDRDNVLADGVEALIGAVYVDRGLELAREVARRIVQEPLMSLMKSGGAPRDAKSELQERVQAEGGPTPRYRVVNEEGPDHQRIFVVVVEIGGDTIGEGRGRSKKSAEQSAARSALEIRGVPRSQIPAPVSSRKLTELPPGSREEP
jgi:ribonuclease-3